MKPKQGTTYIEENLSVENNEEKVAYFLKVVHELKTPIHGIQGLAEYLLNNWDDTNTKTQKECINSILEASQRLSELSSSLTIEKFNQSSIGFNFTKIDLVDATKKVVNHFKSTYLLDSKISLKLQINIDSFIVDADELWYEQLLMNLLVNAFNYSKDGVISVGVSSKKIHDKEYLITSIADEGVGIPEPELNSIFNPYNRSSRTDSNTQGTGLGLSICREIIQAHNGIITAVNNKKAGSTIEFSIPK